MPEPGKTQQLNLHFFNENREEAEKAAAAAAELHVALIEAAPQENKEALYAELIEKAKDKETALRAELTKAEGAITEEPLHTELTKAAEEEVQEAIDKNAGARTSQGVNLPEAPEATYLRDLKDWYSIFFKAGCTLNEFAKYCAEVKEYLDQTKAKLHEVPDNVSSQESERHVVTVATTTKPHP